MLNGRSCLSDINYANGARLIGSIISLSLCGLEEAQCQSPCTPVLYHVHEYKT